MTHVSKVTGKRYQIMSGIDTSVTPNENYDITFIMEWPEEEEYAADTELPTPKFTNWYFGEYTYKDTEDFIQIQLNKVRKLKDLQSNIVEAFTTVEELNN